MKYFILLSTVVTMAFAASAQTEIWSDVPIIDNTFAEFISDNGEWIVGYSDEGGTVVFNRITKNAKYFPGIDYGRGHVASDNGWIVGGQMSEYETDKAIVIVNDKTFTPDVFDPKVSGNIHSITPDGSRICGNIGSTNQYVEYLPYYCDIDANGNFGKLQILPYPKLDFFGDPIQYASAVWLSEDGKTIAGQVISSRGFAVYPIIYRQQSDGSWQYTMPSEKLFNKDNLPIPDPIPEIEVLYPEAPCPDPQDYMDHDQYLLYQMSGGNPEDFMTNEQIEAYYEAVSLYFDAVEKYMDLFDDYMNKYWEITDCSVFFERNNMALSPNAKWLLITSEVEDVADPLAPAMYKTPYLCNLETKEWISFGDPSLQYHSNQVLNDGTCFVNIISDGVVPATTYVYQPNTKELLSLDKYVYQTNPDYKNWFEEYLTSNIIVGGDYDNPDYSEEPFTVTGLGVVSTDLNVLVAGVDGYTLNKDMYFSYILSDLYLESGIESIDEENLSNQDCNIYSLQGVKILSTKDRKVIKNLPAGIYVINGQKTIKNK